MTTIHHTPRWLLAALALAAGGRAAAVDTPHWGATNASGCQGCHQIHNAPGIALTNQAGNENVCFQCHASSGWATTQQASPSGGTGSSHRWDAVVATSPYATAPTNAGCPSADPTCITDRIDATGRLMCSTCHDQHSGANEPFTPDATSYTSGAGAGRKFMRMPNNAGQLCAACHSDRQTAAATDLRTWDGGNKSHPVGAGKTLATRDPTLYDTAPLDVNGALQVAAGSPDADGNASNDVVLLNGAKASYTQGEVVCLTCHRIHFADSNSATVDAGPTAAGDGNLLRRSFRTGSPTAAAPADADDACLACHKVKAHSSATTDAKYGTWSKACKDCHVAHGTTNLLLVQGTLSSKAVTLRQLSAGDASLGGVAPNDLADGAGNGPCEACHTRTQDARATGAQPRFRTTGGGANGMHFGKNCTACHSHVNGFAGRESAGGETCYPCHSYGMRTADASRAATYHHVIESDSAAAYTLPIGSPASTVPTLATSDGDKRCTQCHVDHPFGATRAANLRSGIGTGPSSLAADWDPGAPNGPCLSCHASQLDKNQTDQKADGTTKTLAVDAAEFASSAHKYGTEPGGRVFRPAASTFSVACVKCHSDGQPTATQDGTFQFALHASQDRRLLSPLGAPAADNLEEKFCYRCHSASTDASPGGGPAKSVTANDWYGAVTNMSPGATDIYRTMQEGTAGTPGGAPTTTTNVLYFKPSAQEAAPVTLTGHYGNDTFASGTFTTRSMSPFAPTAANEPWDNANTTSSTTNPARYRRVAFVSPPVATQLTLSAAAWTLSPYVQTSTTSPSPHTRYAIWKYDGTCTYAGASPTCVAIVPRTTYGSGTTNRWATALAAQTITTAAGAATTLNVGDRLVVDLEVETQSTTASSVTMNYVYGTTAQATVTLPNAVTFTYASQATPASGRHDVGNYAGVHRPSPADETRAYIAANRHVECADCHDPHAAQKRPANSIGTATAAGTTTTLVDGGETWTANQWVGAQVIVRSGARAYLRGSVTANTATTLTFTPAMASATAAGDQYVLEFRNGSGNATAATTTTLTDTSRTWVANQWAGYTVSIVTGTGAGQQRTIASNTNNALTVSSAWTTTPAAGSDYAITKLPAAMTGAAGVDVTAWGNSWLGPTTFSPSSTTAALPTAVAQWQVCLKCHSSANANVTAWRSDFTDLALELNPNNASYHPVVSALPATDPGANGSSQLNAAQLVNGWTPGQTMLCTDCHNADAAAPAAQGPHGSAVRYMLAGVNKAWPYTAAGASSGALFTTSTSETNAGTSDGLFCRNCHPPMNNTSPSGEMHALFNGQHSGNAIATCVRCHIRVPHGGKVSRLIVTTNAPPRYQVSGQTPNLTSFTKQAYTGYTVNNSFVTAPCSQHSGGTAEAW